MSDKTILVWFRNDLRIGDNEILSEAIRKADKVLPVYIFDPYYFKTSAAGGAKTGSFRARFLLESVTDLRENLRGLGSELIVRIGDPAEVIPQLADEYKVSEVYHHREVAPEETTISERVETALWKMKLNLKHFIGHTLYHKEDLPFPIKDIPDSFVTFKKKVERDSTVRPCTATPDRILTPEITEAGEVPLLADLGIPQPVDDQRAANTFTGGETAAHERLQQYFANQQVGGQKQARNSGVNSSGLGPWLAVGCISPRQVYWEVVQYQRDNHLHNADPLMLELLWRDYFRFMFKKHGQKFFRAEGFNSAAPEQADNQDELFEQWKNGETGVPYIDAAMHELNATGYINNYSRQAVASFLTNDLKVDWTKGALYFEEKLIDYSPASNWGNWAFVAGVGNDTKSNRYFNAAKPAEQPDGKNDFIAKWLPASEIDGQLSA